MEESGVARSLAEPNLTALSGDTASFLAGGEFPIPVAGSLGSVTVEYKRYGVGLAFTPTVLKGGLINLKIVPEVSQFDPNHSVNLGNGLSVPALIVRRADTTVELRDGQSFVIGGLLQNNSTTAQEQLPWLGDVPILGALFSSKSYQKKETDLAIIVTPRLVRPARPGDVVKTPLDKTLPANDIDFFLMGKSEIRREASRLASGATHPMIGHVLESAENRRRHCHGQELSSQPARSLQQPHWPAVRISISTAGNRSRSRLATMLYANQVTHMVDPWPAQSANRNIALTARRCSRRSTATATTR